MNKILHQSMISINKAGLVFTDVDGNQVRIQFDDCRKNWVNYVNRSTEFDTSDLKEEETNCVGWRDAFDKVPYIEFFSEPKTRFLFPYRRTFYEWFRNMHSRKGYKHFRNMCNQLKENGWSTFDLG
ncbi:hypothetical protein QFZ81_002945 [Paenibacillus sp. V4I9]|uniref:hypothetical protein n=1 Tax=Paenibacillus sp. V4I9 TaxID=3042308 RepID=UPI0027814206|nr:hypothetical protein [Paenibacillus sp. V4I9]MDQ0887857.1 hypothetical protein [Paenibacillus sp. V4I9]